MTAAPKSPSDIDAALRRAAGYVGTRQCADGGFCFYRTQDLCEPNLADTHHAVATLRLLAQPIPRAEDVAAFAACQTPGPNPEPLHHLACIRLALDERFQPDAALRDQIERLPLTGIPAGEESPLSAWLTRTALTVALKRRFTSFREAAAVQALVSSLVRDGGFGPGPNLLDTATALRILKHCGAETLPGASASFVESLQHPTLGFAVTDHARLARLDVLAAGVECCTMLDRPVRYPRAAITLALACQHAKGAFGRAPDSLPDLAMTHVATRTLLRLAHRA